MSGPSTSEAPVREATERLGGLTIEPKRRTHPATNADRIARARGHIAKREPIEALDVLARTPNASPENAACATEACGLYLKLYGKVTGAPATFLALADDIPSDEQEIRTRGLVLNTVLTTASGHGAVPVLQAVRAARLCPDSVWLMCELRAVRAALKGDRVETAEYLADEFFLEARGLEGYPENLVPQLIGRIASDGKRHSNQKTTPIATRVIASLLAHRVATVEDPDEYKALVEMLTGLAGEKERESLKGACDHARQAVALFDAT